jgi:uncharacterized membrane protein (UPF0127 family)
MLGLLGEKGLAQGSGLVIRPCWSIHTLFMRFPIDVIFVDKAGHLKKWVNSMRAWRFAASRGAYQTIEIEAGVLEGYDVRVGDPIQIVAVD